jgi:hypothetical protein
VRWKILIILDLVCEEFLKLSNRCRFKLSCSYVIVCSCVSLLLCRLRCSKMLLIWFGAVIWLHTYKIRLLLGFMLYCGLRYCFNWWLCRRLGAFWREFGLLRVQEFLFKLRFKLSVALLLPLLHHERLPSTGFLLKLNRIRILFLLLSYSLDFSKSLIDLRLFHFFLKQFDISLRDNLAKCL